MSTRTIKDAIKALQTPFSAAKIPLSLPTETRRMLQSCVDDYNGEVSEEESARTNLELRNFWEQHVGENPSKSGLFVGVLRELGPAIVREADIIEWWQLLLKPIVGGTGYRKTALEDAQEFLVGCMAHDDDDEDDEDRHAWSKTSSRLLSELLRIYVTRTRGLTDDDQFIAQENAQIAQQVENVLVAFGRKQPKKLFHSLDDLVTMASTRLQGLTLLSSFLRHQTPHLYLVIHTPLIEHLLKCLMNDTSTTVLSAALTSLIMLLPHVPGSLGSRLPRLFLIYSRLLCWEKFSPLSTEAQKNLVTDDRVSTGPEADHGDVGIDPSWQKVRPKEGLIEAATPELLTYFTYMYGLYPLNFMSYIRKPRRYLRNAEYPCADDFDLDQTVIRERTEQFRQVHLLHRNFFNLTIEEELIDPKWPKTDPADVVADCHALCINTRPALVSPGPPPTGKLPDVPPLPPLANFTRSGQVSPSTSHASFRSGTSGRDTQSTAMTVPVLDGDSPLLRPRDLQQDDSSLRPRSKASNTNRNSPSLEDFPQPGGLNVTRSTREKEDAPQTNIAYLQRENTMLRNELNFERWHKAQYSQHISQLMRKNVKDATVEAETLNLINANRTLKLQLEQVRNAREATLKDSALTRKQANSLETNMTERFNSMKKEQETWRADAEELRRLRKETGQYRELLVATEARESKKTHYLEIVKRDLEKMQDVQAKLQKAEVKLREFEYREFEMDRAKREQEILQHEKETLQMRIQRHQQDHERTRQAYANKVEELEAQLEETSDPYDRRKNNRHTAPDVQVLVQQAIADSQAKLNQLKKKHTALMERHSDLEMEYESVKSQLDAMQANRNGHGGHTFLRNSAGDGFASPPHDRHAFDTMSGGLGQNDSGYDNMSDYNAPSESAYTVSTSDPTNRRFQPPVRGLPVSTPRNEATLHNSAGLTWKPQQLPVSRQDSLASRSSGAPATYNQTAPLGHDETIRDGSKSAFSVGSEETGHSKKEKIKPDSQVRVYGRGGAQNIKLKPKDKGRDDKPEKSKGGFRGLLKS